MATGITPIIENVKRFPHQIAKAIQMRPSMLDDESTETVEEVVQVLVKSGHRAELLAVCEESGLDLARRAIIRAMCSPVLH